MIDPSESSHSPSKPSSPSSDRWFDRLLCKLGIRAAHSAREDLADALADSAPDADFSGYERAMLKNVLELRGRRVDDVMIPRADIIAVSGDISLGDLLSVFRTAGHSRLPVFQGTLDDPKGMVHIRDFLDLIATRAGASTVDEQHISPVASSPRLETADLSASLLTVNILRPVLFTPPSMPAIDLLARMQARRTHMALVIDEYGGTDGLVSIEDLVEMVVGDIEDEHDDAHTPLFAPGAANVFIADARASLDDLSTAFGVNLVGDELAEEVDTLGGLIVTLIGRVPARGELITGPSGLEFEILDADARRIKRVRIHHNKNMRQKRSLSVGGPEEDPVSLVKKPNPSQANTSLATHPEQKAYTDDIE